MMRNENIKAIEAMLKYFELAQEHLKSFTPSTVAFVTKKPKANGYG